MSWQDFYAHWGNTFGITGPFYGPQGHRGSDVTSVSDGEIIPAYRAGVVVKVQYSSYLGTVVVVQADADGFFDGYCHAREYTLVKVGDRVAPGRGLGYVAGFGDRHGSSWDAPHCHLTRSDHVEGVFSGTVLDPRPTVLAAVAASLSSAPASAGPSTPITLPPGGIDDMAAVQIIQELNVPDGTARFGMFPTPAGFTHIQSKAGIDGMVQVNALCVGMGLTPTQAIRGVNSAEFDAIAAAFS